MSAAYKNAKRKLSQTELRKFMSEHKTKNAKEAKKVDSPLAKYNDQGQLTCALCKSVVRSEAVWTVHVNAKQHKQNVELAKRLKERTNNFTTPLKRPLTPPLPDVPEKKLKSILKNANPPKNNDTSGTQNVENKVDTSSGNGLPEDFFDSKNNQKPLHNHDRISSSAQKSDKKMEIEVAPEEADALPEGFFDDPKLDAKARNQEYKDPVEEEWEKFVKEIKDADNKSAAIIAEDQEEATTERQIDEIEEQMKNLSKVLDFEKKKVEIIAVSNDTKNGDGDEEDNENDESEFDEFLDWRSKHSFK